MSWLDRPARLRAVLGVWRERWVLCEACVSGAVGEGGEEVDLKVVIRAVCRWVRLGFVVSRRRDFDTLSFLPALLFTSSS